MRAGDGLVKRPEQVTGSFLTTTRLPSPLFRAHRHANRQRHGPGSLQHEGEYPHQALCPAAFLRKDGMRFCLCAPLFSLAPMLCSGRGVLLRWFEALHNSFLHPNLPRPLDALAIFLLQCVC